MVCLQVSHLGDEAQWAWSSQFDERYHLLTDVVIGLIAAMVVVDVLLVCLP